MRIRFGHFNIRDLTLAKLSDPRNLQASSAAAIIKRMRPQVLSINEMERHDEASGLFSRNFLEQGSDAIQYPFRHVFPTNSGVPTGHPVPFEFKGYGLYPGQYGIALFSQFPFSPERARSFLDVPWNSLPEACRADMAEPIPADYPVMGTNMLDIPLEMPKNEIRIILMHASPPIYGHLNLERNAGQLCLLDRYVKGERIAGSTPRDEAPFVVMGDLNADYEKGDGKRDVIVRLLENPFLQPLKPLSDTFLDGGGEEDPPFDDTGQRLKLDYILPSREFEVLDYGVFWPKERGWWITARRASDHFFIHADCEI